LKLEKKKCYTRKDAPQAFAVNRGRCLQLVQNRRKNKDLHQGKRRTNKDLEGGEPPPAPDQA